MSCIKLKNDLDNGCVELLKKYFQQVVLINKNDIESYYIQSPQHRNFDTNRYLVSFTLKPNTRGFRVTNTHNGNNVFGFYNKSENEGIPQYKHSVQISTVGIDERTKVFLDHLDFSQYIAIIQSYNGLIEVYGFQYGLKTDDYEVNPANNGGGTLIELSSDDDVLEDERPYIYISAIEGNEDDDFNNNFENNHSLPIVQKLIANYEDKFIQDHDNNYLTTDNY